MTEPKTPTARRGWQTIEEFERVVAGVFERVEREAVGVDEWDRKREEEAS